METDKTERKKREREEETQGTEKRQGKKKKQTNIEQTGIKRITVKVPMATDENKNEEQHQEVTGGKPPSLGLNSPGASSPPVKTNGGPPETAGGTNAHAPEEGSTSAELCLLVQSSPVRQDRREGDQRELGLVSLTPALSQLGPPYRVNPA